MGYRFLRQEKHVTICANRATGDVDCTKAFGNGPRPVERILDKSAAAHRCEMFPTGRRLRCASASPNLVTASPAFVQRAPSLV
jgi:hypothetical protein